MGTEFFNRNKGEIRKVREKQKVKLANELPPIVTESTVINFNTWTSRDYDPNQKFEICIEKEDTLTAFCERTPVGFVKADNTKMYQQIRASGGRAYGTLDRLLKRSGQLCLKVIIPENEVKNGQINQLGTRI